MKISNAKLDAASNQWHTAFFTALARARELDLITDKEKVEFERLGYSQLARMDTLHHQLHNAEKVGRAVKNGKMFRDDLREPAP